MSDDAKTILENLDRLAEYNDGYGYPDIGDQVRDAIALIGRLTLRWSSERPAVPGRYFMRMKNAGGNGTLCILDDQWLRQSDEWFGRREWAGPMVDPLEPTPETGDNS